MTVTIRVLGDPVLRKVAAAVDPRSPSTVATIKVLHAALADFRKKNGFGRAIAAPQIGSSIRAIALTLPGRGAFTVFNPAITRRADKSVTLWDDCLSVSSQIVRPLTPPPSFQFPDLMVRVRRDASIDLSYPPPPLPPPPHPSATTTTTA
jgi:peptide deformylase